MFFTKTGLVVAYVMFIASIFRIAQGFVIGSNWMGPWQEVLPRYSSKATPGAIIDQAVYILFLSIILGVIVEISRRTKT